MKRQSSMDQQQQNHNNAGRRQSVTKNSRHNSKQEIVKKGSDLYWGTVSLKPFNDVRFQCEGAETEDQDSLSMMMGDENEYLCSECRSSKIDGHLMTLKKLREKALKYTSQLDEIRTATKKRERELSDVMERLQLEEKNLHAQLENVDQLSFKMNMRRNQLRQDQMALQHEENSMAERLQVLKEKEIFVNCQMVKLQSQETAIKHRRRELNKEKLRIEKLAYLIFKTDLSTMTYKEFHSRIGKMQSNLEKKFRKMKVLEHYCQHKNLPVGMKMEPITPIEQTLDPALTAFKEALWDNNCSDLLTSNGSSMKLFGGDDSPMTSFNYNCKSGFLQKGLEDSLEKYSKKLPKETESQVLKASFKAKALAKSKDGRLAFFQSQQSSFTTTIYETDSDLTTAANSHSGCALNENHNHRHGHDNMSHNCNSNDISISNSNCSDANSINNNDNGSKGQVNNNSCGSLQHLERSSKQSSEVYPTATKKSKSEQEKIVKEVSNNVQRLVMSAKDVCASAHRLLQTPLTFDNHHHSHHHRHHHHRHGHHNNHGHRRHNHNHNNNSNSNNSNSNRNNNDNNYTTKTKGKQGQSKSKNNVENNHKSSTNNNNEYGEDNKMNSGSSQPDEDFIQEEFDQELKQHRNRKRGNNNANENDEDDNDDDENDQLHNDSASDSFLTDISQAPDEMVSGDQSSNSSNHSEIDEGDEDDHQGQHGDQVADETEIIHRRISKLENCGYRQGRLSRKVSGDLPERELALSGRFKSSNSLTNIHSNSPSNCNSQPTNSNYNSNCNSDSNNDLSWKSKGSCKVVETPVVDEHGEMKICSIFRNTKNDEEKVSSQSLIHSVPVSGSGRRNRKNVPFKHRWKQSSQDSVKCDEYEREEEEDGDDEELDEEEEVDPELVEEESRQQHNSHIDSNSNRNHNNSHKSNQNKDSGNTMETSSGSRRAHPPENEQMRRKRNHEDRHPKSHNHNQDHHNHHQKYKAKIVVGDTSQKSLQDNCESSSQLGHYDEIVKDRLSRLSETTRNEIVYAIGQKALAQVAQAMDKVVSSRLVVEQVENPPSKHGDHHQKRGGMLSGLGVTILPMVQSSCPSGLSNELVPRNMGHDPDNNNHSNNNNTDNNNNNGSILSQDRSSRTSGAPDHSYLAMIRRGMHTPMRKGPRKIPSHLKFGNFNIKHRNRKNGNTYRSSNSNGGGGGGGSSNQMSLVNPSGQIPHNLYHNLEQSSHHHYNHNNSSLVPLGHHHQHQHHVHHQSHSHGHHEGAVESKSSSKALSNGSVDKISCEERERDFPESNYTVGLVAEKILGIHTLANPSRRRDQNHALANKLSHSRAFRV